MLNLDLTVAVTQNFVSPANLEAAVQWQALGAGKLSVRKRVCVSGGVGWGWLGDGGAAHGARAELAGRQRCQRDPGAAATAAGDGSFARWRPSGQGLLRTGCASLPAAGASTISALVCHAVFIAHLSCHAGMQALKACV